MFMFDPFLDMKEVKLKAPISSVFPTPLRHGKVLLFYNRADNLLVFSKNYNSGKYPETDLQVDSAQKVFFQF